MIDFAKLRAVLREGTERPWRVSEEGIYGISIQAENTSVAEWDDLPFDPADATLAVEAVNSLGELLDRVQALEKIALTPEQQEAVAKWVAFDAGDRDVARMRLQYADQMAPPPIVAVAIDLLHAFGKAES